MSDSRISGSDASLIAKELIGKVNREIPSDFIQFGTVVATGGTSGLSAAVSVHMDGDPAGLTVDLISLIGGVLYAGLRVAVIFDRPHGAYVIGTPSVSGTPAARGEWFTQDTGSASPTDTPSLIPLDTTGRLSMNGGSVGSDGLVAGVPGVYRYSAFSVYSQATGEGYIDANVELAPRVNGAWMPTAQGSLSGTAEVLTITVTGMATFGDNEVLEMWHWCSTGGAAVSIGGLVEFSYLGPSATET